MSKIRILGILTALFVGALYLGACQNNVNTTLEDSIAPYMELEAIQGASNATLTVNRGESRGLDSYFAFEVRNVKSNGMVREGLTEGWCLEWDKPMSQNNDVHTGIEMYNTFGSRSWKPANYLMNIKSELHSNDPELTYREIQVALWSLIEEPRFDLDQVLRDGDMPTRLMNNGQPNFSVEKVNEIVERVRSEVANFEYEPGTPVIVFSNTGSDEQNGGTVTCGGETAWAQGTEYSEEEGWAMYVPYDDDGMSVPLIAGQHYEIGTVSFSAPDKDYMVTITIELNAQGGFQDTDENVKIQGYNGTPPNAPGGLGGFDYKWTVNPDETTLSIQVPQYEFYAVHVDAIKCDIYEETR